MLVSIIFAVLALIIPLWVMRPFGGAFRILVLMIITGHIGFTGLMHFNLIKHTGSTVVYDEHEDTRVYYEKTMMFSGARPFSITIEQAKEAADGSNHFGYQYLLATLWTITDDPMLAMRMFKIMLYFTGLSCLTRVWQTNYDSSLAMWGFIFLGLIFTPASYYFFRNLKDCVILGVFMLIMSLLDTLLRGKENMSAPINSSKFILGWLAALVLILLLSTIRFYISGLIILSLCFQTLLTTNKLGFRFRVFLMVILSSAIGYAFYSGKIASVLQQGDEVIQSRAAIFTVRAVLQAFLSPLPWGIIWRVEPLSAPFYCLYWLLLPYALFCMIRHFKSNITWHLFIYIMILYIVGVAIGDPPRKRLIVFPILVTWVLSHLAYKYGTHIKQVASRTQSDLLQEQEQEEGQETI